MKNKKSILLILLLILTGHISCRKEFFPHVNKNVELLVVEGAITDKPGPYTVKLSLSSNVLQEPSYKPYPNCSIEILDDMGNQERLTEVAKGVYKTDSLGIQGVAGRKYKIKISTPDGELYESREEVLNKGVGIQSVNAEYAHKNDGSFFGRDGYQFYIDAENPSADTSYYFWSLESTYKFKTDWPIHEYYDGDGSIKPFPNQDSLMTGYRTQQIKEIYTLNSSEQSQRQVLHFPLWYEDNYTKALTLRYSLKVSQYILTKNAYTYWNTLRKMNANQGSIYTQQPYQVRGNVMNINHPATQALGYFIVAGMNEKRIFLDPIYTAFHYPICVPDTGSGPSCGDCAGPWIYHSNSDIWPIYITVDPVVHKHHVLNPRCVDCRVEGFLKKPDYWID